MFKNLESLKAHYQELRNHPAVHLYEDASGLICTWNPKTRLWDWYVFSTKANGYIQTGSTEKRGKTTKIG